MLTGDGRAIFVADDADATTDDDGRRIWEIGAGAAATPFVRVEKFVGASNQYEPQRLPAGTGDALNGVTLFRAFKDRPALPGPGDPPRWSTSAGRSSSTR